MRVCGKRDGVTWREYLSGCIEKYFGKNIGDHPSYEGSLRTKSQILVLPQFKGIPFIQEKLLTSENLETFGRHAGQ